MSTPIEPKDGVFLYRKEDNEDTLFAGVSKKTSRRNSRNERRNSRAKVLHHNPEIYSQFSRFGLAPPSSTKDVATVMNSLRDKQVMPIYIDRNLMCAFGVGLLGNCTFSVC